MAVVIDLKENKTASLFVDSRLVIEINDFVGDLSKLGGDMNAKMVRHQDRMIIMD